jgi:uncharacterized membrane protein
MGNQIEDPVFFSIAFLLVGMLLFSTVAKFLPRKRSLEQTQQWKIAVFYAMSAFGLMELIILAAWFAEVVTNISGGDILSITELAISFVEAVLGASCLGIYMAIFILVMVFWKFRYAPWLSYDLQVGASQFDTRVEYLRKLGGWFHRTS